MKASIIKDLCMGCGLCVGICPTVFDFGDGVAKVILDPIPESEQGSVKEAMDGCPVGAITLD